MKKAIISIWGIGLTILTIYVGNEANAKLGSPSTWYKIHTLKSFWFLAAYIVVGALFSPIENWVLKIYKDKKGRLIEELTEEVQNRLKGDFKTELDNAKVALRNEAGQKVSSTLRVEKHNLKREIKEIMVKEIGDELRNQIDREKKLLFELLEEKIARFEEKRLEAEKFIGAQQYQQSIHHVESNRKYTIDEIAQIWQLGTQHNKIPVPEGSK